MDEKIFTTEQVANILQVHPFTILKFIKSGKLKGIKLGRVYRIKESDINKFLEDRITASGRPKKNIEQNSEIQKKIEKKSEKQKKIKEIPEPTPQQENIKNTSFAIDILEKDEENNNYYVI